MKASQIQWTQIPQESVCKENWECDWTNVPSITYKAGQPDFFTAS